jgi:hypothetical protein
MSLCLYLPLSAGLSVTLSPLYYNNDILMHMSPDQTDRMLRL